MGALKPAAALLAVAMAVAALARTPPPAPRPNVVVILVDTLRADHLPAYGYRRDTAPFLTRLAANGVVFTAAQSTSAWTAPPPRRSSRRLPVPAPGGHRVHGHHPDARDRPGDPAQPPAPGRTHAAGGHAGRGVHDVRHHRQREHRGAHGLRTRLRPLPPFPRGRARDGAGREGEAVGSAGSGARARTSCTCTSSTRTRPTARTRRGTPPPATRRPTARPPTTARSGSWTPCWGSCSFVGMGRDTVLDRAGRPRRGVRRPRRQGPRADAVRGDAGRAAHRARSGTVRGPRQVAEPVSLLDVLPTLRDLAGAPAEPRDEGRSLRSLLEGGAQDPERRSLLAHLLRRDQQDRLLHSVRRGRWKYIEGTRDPALLFDLARIRGRRPTWWRQKRGLRATSARPARDGARLADVLRRARHDDHGSRDRGDVTVAGVRPGSTASGAEASMPKAIRFHAQGGPEVLQYEDVDVGEPGPGQARLRHTAIGVNFLDTYQRSASIRCNCRCRRQRGRRRGRGGRPGRHRSRGGRPRRLHRPSGRVRRSARWRRRTGWSSCRRASATSRRRR